VVAHPSSDYILVSGTHGKIVLITADLAEARISTVAEYRRVPQSTAE
jgi:transposase